MYIKENQSEKVNNALPDKSGHATLFFNGIYYETAGSGETVIFLHGWGGGIASFKGTYAHMSKCRRVVNIEFPGFGQSAVPEKPYTIYDYAEKIKDFILFLDCGSVTVVGHSFGGRIALILAAEYPGLIKKIILIDAAGLKPRRGFKYCFRKLKYKMAKILVTLKIKKRESLKKYGSADYRALSGVMQRTFVNVINEHLDKLPALISCPALIIWGSKDKDTPLYMAKRLNKSIKNSRIIVYKGAGHYSYIDRFNDCNNEIRKFTLC